MRKIIFINVLFLNLLFGKEVFIEDQSYLCINQGILVEKNVIRKIDKYQALKNPIKFFYHKELLILNHGLDFSIIDKEKKIYGDKLVRIWITINDKNIKSLLFFHKLIDAKRPAVYHCVED